MPATLEDQVAELRSEIDKRKSTASEKRAAAEQHMLAEKAKNPGLLTDTSDAGRSAFETIQAGYKEADTLDQEAETLKARLNTILDENAGDAISASGGDPSHPQIVRARNIGQIATASKQYESLLASNALKTEGARIDFDPVEVLAYDEAARFLASGRVHLADVGDGSPLVPTDERLDPVMLPKRAPSVLEMINVQATRREAVTWVKQVLRTDNSGPQPYGTPLDKSRYTFQRVPVPMIRMGHHAVVDEGNISDSDEFQGIVNGELTSDLRLKVESKVMSGPGGGSDFTGIYNDAGIGDFDATGESLADAYHKALTTVRIQLEAEPTSFGLSPLAFEAVYLEKGSDGHYLHHRGTLEGGPQTIWGKPAMTSTVFTTPIVGEWRRGATLYVNEGIAIVVGRIDDQLLEGLFTIRAQTRSGLAVKQPKAFCTISNLGL